MKLIVFPNMLSLPTKKASDNNVKPCISCPYKQVFADFADFMEEACIVLDEMKAHPVDKPKA